jgi:two-component system cell cycle sensor histidine kinase/response regulator CckA
MDVPLETLLDSIDEAVLTIDDAARVVFLNEAGARLFNCTPSAVTGQPAATIPSVAAVLAQLDLDFANPHSLPARTVRRIQWGDAGGARAVPMEAVVSHVYIDGHRLITTVLRDVSFQQEMEQAVYDARKNQALGALAGGIAHDFNNVLAAVISQIDLALYSPGFPAHLREHLIHAQTSARRGAELVSKLQLFGQQRKPDLGPVNPAELLDQLAFVLRRSVDPKISIQTPGVTDRLWDVTADAGQILQALLNLGLNARDAMPRGGTLTLAATNVRFSDADAIAPRRAGEFVRFTVCDTGEGMTPDVASRVFEPYFSTKDLSRGPGLGLSITAALVAEHSGWLEVQSEVGRGSAFSIVLPRSTAAAVETPKKPVETSAVEGRERILVVDDEEMVRMVIKAVLAYRGYEVTEAQDGEEAVTLYGANPGGYDLVLLDLHMPKLNGHEALLRIRKINPNAKAVMLSGGVQDVDGELDPIVFLQKPFENQELLRVVRQLLDGL